MFFTNYMNVKFKFSENLMTAKAAGSGSDIDDFCCSHGVLSEIRMPTKATNSFIYPRIMIGVQVQCGVSCIFCKLRCPSWLREVSDLCCIQDEDYAIYSKHSPSSMRDFIYLL
jgi:hypothetical protein